MKICLKCKKEHNKKGTHCSRKCANSRTWSKADKLKKSISSLNSEKVKIANSNPNKIKNMREKLTQAHLEGKIFASFCNDEIRNKAIATNKRKMRERLLNIDYFKKDNYRKACQFRFSLNTYPNEFDFSLIEKYGWYKAKNKGNNPRGISRDHKLSISDGWKLKINPIYMRHPANCQLLNHDDNWNKRSKSSVNKKELLDLINSFDKKYGGIV